MIFFIVKVEVRKNMIIIPSYNIVRENQETVDHQGFGFSHENQEPLLNYKECTDKKAEGQLLAYQLI